MQLGQLVLRQRLGRKQIQRARGRILENAVEDRRVVAERLARRRRRDDDDVPPGQRVLDGLGLVRVELRDAARAERPPEPGVDRLRKGRVGRRHGRQPAHRRDVRVVACARDSDACAVVCLTPRPRARPACATARPRAIGPCRR